MRYLKKISSNITVALLLVFSANQNLYAEENEQKEEYSPTTEQMVLDGLVLRPLSLAATAIGTGIFVVTLPFSLLGGNVDEAGEKLVMEPAGNTFTKCLGCLTMRDSSYLE